MLDYDELRRSSAMAEEREEIMESEGGVRRVLGALTPAQRFILALILFLNVFVLGCFCLFATNRIALPF